MNERDKYHIMQNLRDAMRIIGEAGKELESFADMYDKASMNNMTSDLYAAKGKISCVIMRLKN